MTASEERHGDPAEAEEEPAPESEWARRRRLAAIFGDVVPDQTSDQTSDDAAPRGGKGDGKGVGKGGGKGDEWYREQVPPHHG